MGDYNDESDSNESLEQLLAIDSTDNRFPNAGDEVEEVSEPAGLGHALATRTPGPNMRRGDVNPLRLGIGMGAGTSETGMDLGRTEGDIVCFAGWSGSN